MESVKDLVVDVNSTEISIALLENHKLIELNKESSQGRSYSVGDVYPILTPITRICFRR